jgi:hypothetical protein
MAHKRYCSQDCQQKFNRGKADRERRMAWHLFRYMQRNSPKALAKLMAWMNEEKERNARSNGASERAGLASGGAGIAGPAGAVKYVHRGDQGPDA